MTNLSAASATYKIIAKHLAKAAAVAVEFKDGATPSTNGKIITLPSQLTDAAADLTLAALLHEASHVAITDFNASNGLSKNAFTCLNVLEDVRIDAAALVKYPNARQLQRLLINDVINRRREQLKSEPLAIKILKGLILTANGCDLTQLYEAEVVKRVDGLNDYITKALNAKTTKELINPALELARLLLNDAANAAANGDASSGLNVDAINEAKAEAEAAAPALGAAAAAADAAQASRDAAEADYRSAKRKARLNATKATNARRDAANAAANGDAAEAAKAQAKADEYSKRSEAAAAACDAAANVYRQSEANKLNNAKRDAADVLSRANDKLDELSSNAFNATDGCELAGFKALDASAEAAADVSAIDGRAKLDELIKDVIISKRDAAQADDNGSRLNASKLADYQTADDVFLSNERRDYKTRVAVVIDASGSMGNYSNDYDRYYESRTTLAVNAAAVVLDALKKAIDDGAPADFNVWAFADKTTELITSADAYNKNFMVSQLKNRRYDLGGSNTNLRDAVNLIAADLKNKADADDRVIIIITDAEVDERQLTDLRNNAQADDARVLYVGINAEVDRDALTRELFNDHNITNAATAADVLSRALLDITQ